MKKEAINTTPQNLKKVTNANSQVAKLVAVKLREFL